MDSPSGRAGSRCVRVSDQWLLGVDLSICADRMVDGYGSGRKDEFRSPGGEPLRRVGRPAPGGEPGRATASFRLYCKAWVHYGVRWVRAGNARDGQWV